MKEIITLNIGQAGVQLSNAAWELFCIEHGIRSNGSYIQIDEEENNNGIEVFFQRNEEKAVPRIITADSEPTVIDEIRMGAFRHLFNPSTLISGLEDCANNFARGNFSLAKVLTKPAMNQLRRMVEACDRIQGFFFLNSFDGGTGSGFSSNLLELLGNEFSKLYKLQLGIYPSRNYASSAVFPYNAILHTHSTLSQVDLCTMMDNEAVFRVCTEKLNLTQATFTDINRIIAQLFSSLTVSMRYQSFLNSDLDQLSTNLVPYPKIHFPLSHMSPILSSATISKDCLNVIDITRSIYEKDQQMIDCDTMNGLFMSCVLQYRGELTPNKVNKAVYELKRRSDIKFVDWCPTGFKIGISGKPAATVPFSPIKFANKSLTMLSNSTAIVHVWSQLIRKFKLLFSTRAFIHWFIGEGLEEGEFVEALDSIRCLQMDYKEIEKATDQVGVASAASTDVVASVSKQQSTTSSKPKLKNSSNVNQQNSSEPKRFLKYINYFSSSSDVNEDKNGLNSMMSGFSEPIMKHISVSMESDS